MCFIVHLFYIYVFSFFFFSSRRRHTRCALVTGVQTCALPICRFNNVEVRSATTRADKDRKRFLRLSRMGTFRSAHFVFNFPTNLSHEGGLSVITCTLAWPSLDKRLRQADASSSDVTNTKASMPEGNDAAAGTK